MFGKNLEEFGKHGWTATLKQKMQEVCSVYESESKPPPIIRISRKLWQENFGGDNSFLSRGDGALSTNSSFQQRNNFGGDGYSVHHHHHYHHHRHDHYHHHVYSEQQAEAASSQDFSDITNASKTFPAKGKSPLKKRRQSDMSIVSVQSPEMTAPSNSGAFLSSVASLSPIPHAGDLEREMSPPRRPYSLEPRRIALAERVCSKPSSSQRSCSPVDLERSIRLPLTSGFGMRLQVFFWHLGGERLDNIASPISDEDEGRDEPEECHGALDPTVAENLLTTGAPFADGPAAKTAAARPSERQRDPERLVTRSRALLRLPLTRAKAKEHAQPELDINSAIVPTRRRRTSKNGRKSPRQLTEIVMQPLETGAGSLGSREDNAGLVTNEISSQAVTVAGHRGGAERHHDLRHDGLGEVEARPESSNANDHIAAATRRHALVGKPDISSQDEQNGFRAPRNSVSARGNTSLRADLDRNISESSDAEDTEEFAEDAGIFDVGASTFRRDCKNLEDGAELNSMTPEQLRACQQDAEFVGTRVFLSPSPATNKHFSFDERSASGGSRSRVQVSSNLSVSAQDDGFASMDSRAADKLLKGSEWPFGGSEESFQLLQPPMKAKAVKAVKSLQTSSRNARTREPDANRIAATRVQSANLNAAESESGMQITSRRQSRHSLLESNQQDWNKENFPARVRSSPYPEVNHRAGEKQLEGAPSSSDVPLGLAGQGAQSRSPSRQEPAAALQPRFSAGDEVECLWTEPSEDGKYYYYTASVVQVHSSQPLAEYTIRWYDPQGFEAETRVPEKNIRRPRSSSKIAKRRSGSSGTMRPVFKTGPQAHGNTTCQLCGQRVRKKGCKFCDGNGGGCQYGSTALPNQQSFYPQAKRSRCCCRFCGGTDIVKENMRIATCRHCGFSAECGH